MTEIEELKRKLEVVETELTLEGSGGQEEAEGGRSSSSRGDAEVVQIELLPGRKTRRGRLFIPIRWFKTSLSSLRFQPSC